MLAKVVFAKFEFEFTLLNKEYEEVRQVRTVVQEGHSVERWILGGLL